MNTTTQELNDLVNAFVQYNKMTDTDALQLAMLNIDLEKRLANGAVKFVFRKADGTTRTAYGTNKHTIVPNFYTFKGANIPKNTKVTRYFDLEKGAFRSFTKANLISIEAA